jgi:hypothetical protein
MNQTIVERVISRKSELESALSSLPATDVKMRDEISAALLSIGELMTGDLAKVPPVVSADMNKWLERNKHLAK